MPGSSLVDHARTLAHEMHEKAQAESGRTGWEAVWSRDPWAVLPPGEFEAITRGLEEDMEVLAILGAQITEELWQLHLDALQQGRTSLHSVS